MSEFSRWIALLGGCFVSGYLLAQVPDAFSQRASLSGRFAVARANPEQASLELGEPDYQTTAATDAIGSLWWTWRSPTDGVVTLNAGASAIPVELLIAYSGAALTQLQELGRAVRDQSLRLQVRAGDVLQIAVIALRVAEAEVRLDLSFSPTPPNDHFVHALPAMGVELELAAEFDAATTEAGEPGLEEFGATSRSVWWLFAAPTNGVLRPRASQLPRGLRWDLFAGSRLNSLSAVDSVRAGDSYFIRLTDTHSHRPGSTTVGARLYRPRWLRPAASGSVGPGDLLILEVTDELAADEIVRVKFLAAGTEIGEVTSSPWRMNWNPSPGSWAVEAEIYYADAAPLRVTGVTLSVSVALSNDYFANARQVPPLGGLLNHQSVGRATREIGEPTRLTGAEHSLWWRWQAPARGRFVVFGAEGEPGEPEERRAQVSLFRGARLESLAEIPSLSVVESSRRVTAVDAGDEVWILLESRHWPAPSRWRPQVEFVVTPENDQFAERSTLSLETPSEVVNLNGATGEPGEVGTQSVWWRFVAPEDGWATISNPLNISQVTWTAYLEADQISQLQPFPNLERISLLAGQAMAIRANGNGGRIFPDGRVETRIDFVPFKGIPDPVLGDSFSKRASFQGLPVSVSGTTEGATSDPQDPALLGSRFERTVWFEWTAPTDVPVIALLVPSSDNSVLGVWELTGAGSLESIGERGWPSWAIPFQANAGTKYPLLIASSTGDGEFSIHIVPAPIHDDFADRIELLGATASHVAINSFGRRESGEPLISGAIGRSLWYRWTAPATGRAIVTAVGGGFVPMVGLYQGDRIDGLAKITEDEAPSIFENTLMMRYAVERGREYQLVVDGRWKNSEERYGFISLRVDFTSLELSLPSANSSVLEGQSVPFKVSSSHPTLDGTLRDLTLHVIHEGTTVRDVPLDPILPATTNLANLVPGRYLTYADGFNNLGGFRETRTVNFTVRPTNDDWSRRSPATADGILRQFTLNGGTLESGESRLWPSIITRSVWFSFRAEVAGVYVVRVDGADASVFTGNSVQSLNRVSSTSGLYTTFSAEAGTQYSIGLAAPGPIDPTLPYQFSILPPLNNDLWTRAAQIPAGVTNLTGHLFDAHRQSDEPEPASGDRGGTVWWSWTAPGSGVLHLQAQFVLGGNYPSVDVYVRTPSGTWERKSEWSPSWRNAECAVNRGETYLIAVTDYSEALRGVFSLSLTPLLTGGNDRFVDRFAIPDFSDAVVLAGNLLHSTTEPGETSFGGSIW